MWSSVFAVPCDIIDSRLKFCGEIQLKVLLLLLRHNGDIGTSALAAIIGKPEAVIREAVDGLIQDGIIKDPTASQAPPALRYTEVIEQEQRPIEPVLSPEPVAERKITTISTHRRRLERDEINALADNDEAISWLLQEAQSVLQKPLDAMTSEIIVALYSYYEMKPDIILMVLQYCMSIEKTSIGYIEKVAASWRELNIQTHEAAEREIKRRMEQSGDEKRIKAAFGIYDRSLVTAEKKFIPIWFDDYGFDIPLITLAYERAVEAKGKLSFSYINGILKNWHEKCITTPQEALRDMSESRDTAMKKASQQKAAKPSSYDLGEIESMVNQGIF